ncbi:MAG: GGDEF domain-containing protein, partial [Pseudomonadota bacterium]
QAARHAAERDHLTGLLNRRSLRARFNSLVANAGREGRALYGAVIDIDHFKAINDTLGHDVGDLALKRLAGVLCASFRTDDHIFRLGGEEFLVLFEGPDTATLEERLAAARATLLMAEAAGERSRVPVIRFSAGVASWPTDGDTLDAFLKAADRRLYLAKQSGRDRIVQTG